MAAGLLLFVGLGLGKKGEGPGFGSGCEFAFGFAFAFALGLGFGLDIRPWQYTHLDRRFFRCRLPELLVPFPLRAYC